MTSISPQSSSSQAIKIAGLKTTPDNIDVVLLFGRAPKTNAEKRRAVIHVLDDPGLCNRSDAWLAQQCCVSWSLVITVRREREHVRQTEADFIALVSAWAKANEAARLRFVEVTSHWAPGAADDEKATAALALAQACGVSVSLDGGDLILKSRKPILPDVRSALRQAKADLVALLARSDREPPR